MNEIGIYREGGLPPFSMGFLKYDIKVLRCSYWDVYYWQHDSLLAPYWRIYWNDRDGASIFLKGKEWEMKPSRLYLIPPNTAFGSRFELNAPRKERNFLMGCPVSDDDNERPLKSMKHFFIHFTAGLPWDHIGPAVYEYEAKGEKIRLVDELREKLSHPANVMDRQSIFSVRALINLLFLEIPDLDWPDGIVDDRIERILGYMESHYLEPLQVKDLAELINISENGFSRLFRKNTGKSPREFLIGRRLEHACTLLHHSNYSIDEIAVMSGFCDRSYFSRMFIRKYGTGPARFRKTSFNR
ncbi:helix-turn-helix domain-containing protein [Spirochaeta isovalerica]|uniref:AraC-like DNA-binding protein n=1 Tax=Spirochaeta isovalerica TaxID=150 RepID=A0A841R637_9SPIO|nr:AraC family transcriptional regulator [Spirochaeta isovalerica]MBB6480664.1 AraC-like DNA-binding protein [Spirochaeta isovalerica]